MKLIQFIRLLLRNISFLIIVPIILAGMVFFLTKHQTKKYASNTTIYTGIASGYSIGSQGDSRIDYFGVNNAFDNLINIINSRSTLEEVSLTLFARCLMSDKADPLFISEQSYNELVTIVPQEVKSLIDKNSLTNTVAKLKEMMNKNSTNFVYELVNLYHPFFSIDAISGIRAYRISSSDMIEISYESSDPGICRATLEIISNVIIKNYSEIKANQTDAVVVYFEDQLSKSNNRLKVAEDELLQFNQNNKIINYYEQTKSISGQKTDLELQHQNELMALKGAESIINNLEQRLTNTQKIILQNEEITNKRNELSRITSVITFMEIYKDSVGSKVNELEALKKQSKKITEDLNEMLQTIFIYKNEKGGLTSEQILNDWLQNTIVYEESKARIMAMNTRINDFQKEYDTFAPLGAILKRIEREINVAEQEYLSLLHGLSLAKLKQQDLQLSSNIKIIDPPYFPITPEPSKRKILVAIAGMFGFIMVAFLIILMEYFDANIKTPKRIEQSTGLLTTGVYPVNSQTKESLDLSYINKRSIDWLTQIIKQKATDKGQQENPIVLLLFSTLAAEGKSMIGTSISSNLTTLGKKVLYINFSSPIELANLKFNLINVIIDDKFSELADYQSFIRNNNPTNEIPDFIFIEIPDLISKSFPAKLVSNADQAYLVCRSNREWTEADQNLTNLIKKSITKTTPEIILNGVTLPVVEAYVGEIPKKRSFFENFIKKYN